MEKASGDLEYLEICTLGFEEFLTAINRIDLYEEMSLCGESDTKVYQELHKLYNDYCTIGGYPSVVLKYLENAPLQDCQAELLKIIRLFTNESRRYFEDSFSEELQGFEVKDYSSNITKASVNRAIDWLYISGVIGFAGKLPDCSLLDFKAKARCYFTDVYLDLRRRIAHPSEIALETPAFATLGNGEIDFYVKTLMSERTYAVEVKSGKNSGKTATEVLNKKKVDYVLYAKGSTHGGKTDHTITIPIYGISKFRF